jgi:hypothetical protein
MYGAPLFGHKIPEGLNEATAKEMTYDTEYLRFF